MDLPASATLAEAILHIILSTTARWSTAAPSCPGQAILVHMIDNLGGRLGSFDRIEKELPDGQSWSSFDRALSSSAYFAGRKAAWTRLTLRKIRGETAASARPSSLGLRILVPVMAKPEKLRSVSCRH